VNQPRVEAVPFDQPSAEIPFEERGIRDEATFASFSERVVALLQPLVDDPMIQSMWPLVLKRNAGERNLGLRMAQGRHAYEQAWHNETLELPQSAVCQLPEFGWFVTHVLAHLPRFWSAHNDALAAYRLAHRIRNRAQPVPDLTEEDGWLESPFWIWSSGAPHRRPLFVQQSADEIELSDRRSRSIRLSLTADREGGPAVDQLRDLSARGVKIRTRALTTTLFARLVLSDLFLHGIGGAKYDQVTDHIARQFFGFALPRFATVSATLRLPIAHQHAETAQIRRISQQARELRFHPERYVHENGALRPGELSEVESLVASKQRWVATAKTPDNARRRHDAITAANQALLSRIRALQTQIERHRDELIRLKRANTILESREFAFCLFPHSQFERLLLDDPPLAPYP
jgi:hypothetical protein